MAKRFTDTEKWDRPWFQDLPNDYKLLWIYICDKSDIAGIWYVNLRMASFLIGCQFDLAEARRHFSKQIQELEGGTRWIICDFTSFQYGSLRPTNNLHKAVIAILHRHGVDSNSGANEGLTSPSRGAKDKVMVLDKDKDMGEGVGGGGGGRPTNFIKPTPEEVKTYAGSIGFDLDGQHFWDHYESNGWKVGRNPMKDWKAAVRTWRRSEFQQGGKNGSNERKSVSVYGPIAEQIRANRRAEGLRAVNDASRGTVLDRFRDKPVDAPSVLGHQDHKPE